MKWSARSRISSPGLQRPPDGGEADEEIGVGLR
jgi:hypothetical protein